MQYYFGLLGLCGPPTHFCWCWLGEQNELRQNRPIRSSRGEKEVSSPWGQRLSGLGCCDRIPCLWEMEKIPQAGLLWWVPLFRTPVPCYLICLSTGRVVSGLEGKGQWFPWLLTAPGLPPGQCCWTCLVLWKGVSLPRPLSVAWAEALGHLLLLNLGF